MPLIWNIQKNNNSRRSHFICFTYNHLSSIHLLICAINVEFKHQRILSGVNLDNSSSKGSSKMKWTSVNSSDRNKSVFYTSEDSSNIIPKVC